ncbi:Protein of unknown function [Tranquillimonas rosea]|uniref:DUF3307 domain-containing protein n=1 Tax=Tranquillimonas rosea TaxID=641238 RepID=A0A1H9TLG9_9RHOB|nr:DUF3307 domain-containing protein [Tranquillimonas rosea]SER98150.1 Protein of unknown function [Tranquillimonas rosea]
MYQTAAALLFAHVLADFMLQSDGMIREKRRPLVQLAHAAIVLAASLAALGQVVALPVVLLAVAHLGIDRVKLAVEDTIRPFLIDQGAHLITIGAIAVAAPTLWKDGLWPDLLPAKVADLVPLAMLYVAGFIVAVRTGGFAVDKLLAPYTPYWKRAAILSGGLQNGGLLIGQLERGLTYLLVLAGYPTGVAFLIAAKSILRFNASKDDRRIAEYVIIGTLASVGWALAAAFATGALITLAGGPP